MEAAVAWTIISLTVLALVFCAPMLVRAWIEMDPPRSRSDRGR